MESDTHCVSGGPDPGTETADHANGRAVGEVADLLASDAMEVFKQRLEDILKTYGSAATLTEQQVSSLVTGQRQDGKTPGVKEPAGAAAVKDASHFLQSLNKMASPEKKVEVLLKKYKELLEHQQEEQKRHQQAQLGFRQGLQARAKLEDLCKELQDYNKTLRSENLERSQADEAKRREITNHFESTLTDIQGQIEVHCNRNTKLCQENSDLADKLNHIINQYERREESLEKIFKHHDVQHKLAEAKLEQANLLLKEAEVKHKREKEYLLKEAIDKTQKCFTLKEQELQMKKQLVLYSQKFDEFQATLSKSNDVYVSFKKEMDKMTKKMKKLEKESGFWKTRFESCNKALQDLIEERSEKGKEFELFVLKIDKLEQLCRKLQEERKGLYDKIRGIRFDMSQPDSPDDAALKAEEQETLNSGFGLTAEMERLKAEQVRLQEFAASLNSINDQNQLEESEEEDEEEEQHTDEAPPVAKETTGSAPVPEKKKVQFAPAPQEIEPEEEREEPEHTKAESDEKEVVPTAKEVEQSKKQAEGEMQKISGEPIKQPAEIIKPAEAKTEPIKQTEHSQESIKESITPEPTKQELEQEKVKKDVEPEPIKTPVEAVKEEEGQAETKTPVEIKSVNEKTCNPVAITTAPLATNDVSSNKMGMNQPPSTASVDEETLLPTPAAAQAAQEPAVKIEPVTSQTDSKQPKASQVAQKAGAEMSTAPPADQQQTRKGKKQGKKKGQSKGAKK